MNHNELKQKALKKQSVQDEYDALEAEFSLFQTELQAHREESNGCVSFTLAGE